MNQGEEALPESAQEQIAQYRLEGVISRGSQGIASAPRPSGARSKPPLVLA